MLDSLSLWLQQHMINSSKICSQCNFRSWSWKDIISHRGKANGCLQWRLSENYSLKMNQMEAKKNQCMEKASPNKNLISAIVADIYFKLSWMESKLVWKKIQLNHYVIINKTIQVSYALFNRIKNPLNFSYIFILDLNFVNIIVKFFVLCILYACQISFKSDYI